MARNIGPARLEPDQLARSLKAIAARADVMGLLGEGSDPLGRATGLTWLRQFHQIDAVTADQVIQSNCSMHALTTILRLHRADRATVLCDPLTFSGLPIAARAAGLQLSAVESDKDGMCPQALERELVRTAAKLVYLIPTLHNPTTRTLGPERRREIVDVVRKHDALVIEDETYRALVGPGAPALRDLAPERTYYIATMSKVLNHGLRPAYVLGPEGRSDLLRQTVLSKAGYAPPSFGGYLLARWLDDGTARKLIQQNFDLARTRLL